MPTVPLVGAFYRPPAKTLLSIMPTGAELELRPEPENPYDPDAIAVWATAESISDAHLRSKEEELQGAGDCPDFSDPGALAEWKALPRHLGYVAKAATQEVFDVVSEADGEALWPAATLAFAPDGKPQVMF